MKKTSFVRYLGIALCLCLLLTSLTGCEGLINKVKNIKGELIGNHFVIDFYDNFGNNVLTMEGKKVGLEANYVKSKSIDTEGTRSTNFELSSVITMTVDGSQVAQTGNTIIFAEDGLKKLEDFICSQLGVPIAVYGGKSVYWEIPDDLPKTTKLSIDGLALYIHRANYILLDSNMIK